MANILTSGTSLLCYAGPVLLDEVSVFVFIYCFRHEGRKGMEMEMDPQSVLVCVVSKGEESLSD